MIRFDLIVDNDLQVYLMEGNMSPNLSSAHFLPNKLLYVRKKLQGNIKLKITRNKSILGASHLQLAEFGGCRCLY